MAGHWSDPTSFYFSSVVTAAEGAVTYALRSQPIGSGFNAAKIKILHMHAINNTTKGGLILLDYYIYRGLFLECTLYAALDTVPYIGVGFLGPLEISCNRLTANFQSVVDGDSIRFIGEYQEWIET